jgi:CheY-like chemotaxis protein
MPDRYRVALQGFSEFERSALASFFRLAAQRSPAYAQVDALAQADFVIADADHPGVIDEVLAGGRLADTVFVGAQAPEGAPAWMLRPIDPMHVQRELDAMVALRHPQRSMPTLAAPRARPLERPQPRSTPSRRAYESAAPQAAAVTASPADADVLLVDDSEVALRFLERLIQRHGLHARSAQTSGEALALMTQQRFAAVFLDVELGDDSELDGLALCQRIKHQPPQAGRPAPAVVLVSAHGEAVDRVRGTLAGCDAYLTKPLDEDELQRTLRKLGVGSVAAGVRH